MMTYLPGFLLPLLCIAGALCTKKFAAPLFLLQQQRQKAGAVFRCLAVEIVRSGRTDIAEGPADPDILGGGVGAVDHQRHHLTGVVRVSDGRVVAVVRLHDEDIVLAQGVAEGLGSVVHIPVKKEPEQIREFMKVPAGYYLPTLIMLGYAVKNAELPAQVKATAENKVRWNKW